MSNNTIADKLQDLITAKQDMKDAIAEKGVEVEGGLVTYADAIEKIEGSGVRIEGFDWWFPIGTIFMNSEFTEAPLFDTHNFTDMHNMFMGCTNLTTVPSYDTSKVTDMDNMFWMCGALESIGFLDMSKVETAIGWFEYPHPNLTHIAGFKNFGAHPNVKKLYLLECPKLTHTSIMNVINNLYDRTSSGYEVGKLGLGWDVLTSLTDEEKAVATNKGWIIY